MRNDRPIGAASERAFDRVAGLYDSWYSTPLGALVDSLERDLLWKLARPRPNETVLDVGTGTGHWAAELAAQGLTVVAEDISSAMLAQASERALDVRLVRGDAARLPFPDERFDLVISITALEFVAHRERALDEMWRMVRGGGRLAVGVLNELSPWARQRRRDSAKEDTPFQYAHFFSPREFVAMLQRYGEVRWSSSVFVGPAGEGAGWAWALERVGRLLWRRGGALLIGVVEKWQ